MLEIACVSRHILRGIHISNLSPRRGDLSHVIVQKKPRIHRNQPDFPFKHRKVFSLSKNYFYSIEVVLGLSYLQRFLNIQSNIQKRIFFLQKRNSFSEYPTFSISNRIYLKTLEHDPHIFLMFG